MITRRALLGLLGGSLIETALAKDAFAAGVRPEIARLLSQVDELSRSLKSGEAQKVWHGQIESILQEIPIEALLASIDMQRLMKRKLPNDRAMMKRLRLRSPRYTFTTRISGLKKGRAIVPHGHRNVVTARMVILGAVRARHYDRVQDERTHLLLRPTIDKTLKVGEATSISDSKDNVHWFISESEVAYTFDLALSGLKKGLGYDYKIDFVDPERGEKNGALIRAPRMDAKAAFKRYGRT